MNSRRPFRRARPWSALAALLFSLLLLATWTGMMPRASAQREGSVVQAWEFRLPEEAEGFTTHSMEMRGVRGGKLALRINGNGPFFQTGTLDVPASRARRVDVRLSATHGTSLVLYFSTDKDPEFSHGRRIVQPLTADGEIHEVRFETAEHPEWKGTITGLRFAIEPEDTAEGDVEVDSIRIF